VYSDLEVLNRRLQQQIAFIVEIDKAKQILRRSVVTDASRRENDAEHSWHLAVMALILSEYAREPALDLLKVIKMVLVHDLVEIDAGDTYIYDTAAQAGKWEREREAAARIFGMLPEESGAELRAVWEEFEAKATPEARFAEAMDRLQPLLLNYHTRGRMWREHGITSDRVIAVNQRIADGAPELWEYARALIEDAVREGILEAGPDPR
jgi:putative hydrolase of HD superfamily